MGMRSERHAAANVYMGHDGTKDKCIVSENTKTTTRKRLVLLALSLSRLQRKGDQTVMSGQKWAKTCLE